MLLESQGFHDMSLLEACPGSLRLAGLRRLPGIRFGIRRLDSIDPPA
jgi:hypothetical protein